MPESMDNYDSVVCRVSYLEDDIYGIWHIRALT
jgi:hypothetical protein